MTSCRKDVILENKITTLPTQPDDDAHSGGQFKTGTITQLNDRFFIIDDKYQAEKALSCLINPQLGDIVIVFCEGEYYWITAIIKAGNAHAQQVNNVISHAESEGQNGIELNECIVRNMSLPNNQALSISAASFTVNAQESIQLFSGKHLRLTAVMGQLSVSAKSLVQSIQTSCISMAKHWLNRAEYIDQEAEKVLKTHAQHQLMTAEKDVKVDAQRINMG